MATIVEQRSQPLGGGYQYDPMRLPGPHFTNPWGPPSSVAEHHQQQQQQNQLYNPQSSQSSSAAASSDPYANRPQYSSPPTQVPLVDPTSHARSFSHEYGPSAPASAPTYTAPAVERYATEHYSSSYNGYEPRYPPYQQQQQQQQQHQQQQPRSNRSFRPSLSGRDSFSDALDAGQGMVAMSQQQDFTNPRSAFPLRNNSTDSYGFHNGHSDHGSVSSGSSYPYYGSYSGSADGSVAGSSATDYSSASEDVGQRTLPPPGQLLNGGYPAEATQMMTQFNSKLAASAQKKHKCKICDKRFTRPSSLQTHMYSHTGEKPFACDYDGCGRNFSVVSNLRRHKKCHKGDGSIDPSSPEE